MISVKNLTKNYGPVAAVKGISFEVEMGHVYGFLGPNGAGKSTTMNMICGCLAATDGTVTIDGCDILEDAVEALIAAVYIDGGFIEAKKFIMRFFLDHIEKIATENLFRDFKTELQEIIHQYHGYKIEYNLVGYSGPDHDRIFTVEVLLNKEVVGTGVGKSKKDAEKNAAFAAIENYEQGNIKILKRR